MDESGESGAQRAGTRMVQELGALRKRALSFLAQRPSGATGAEITAHTLDLVPRAGGFAPPPPALIEEVERLLRAEASAIQESSGNWRLHSSVGADDSEGWARELASTRTFVAVAAARTGYRPHSAQLISLAAVRMVGGKVHERFAANISPDRPARIPRHVRQRAHLDLEAVSRSPSLREVAPDFFDFVGQAPVVAIEVRRLWIALVHQSGSFPDPRFQPTLIDLPLLARAVLGCARKPSLGAIARLLGVSANTVGRPERDALTVGLVADRLLQRAHDNAAAVQTASVTAASGPLDAQRTLAALPEEPGVYRLLDERCDVLYAGKASVLRTRLQAYVQRPLAETRALDGLATGVATVQVDSTPTDLHALLQEEGDIRRLHPLYNTQRQLHADRIWLILAEVKPGKRRGRRRLRLATDVEEDEVNRIGPFRTAAAARSTRDLARLVFDLDELWRRDEHSEYEARLAQAWEFLRGERDPALRMASSWLAAARMGGADAEIRRWTRALKRVRLFDPEALVWPTDPARATILVVRPGLLHGSVEAFLWVRQDWLGYAAFDLKVAISEPGTMWEQLVGSRIDHSTDSETTVVRRWLSAQRTPGQVLFIGQMADGPEMLRSALRELPQQSTD